MVGDAAEAPYAPIGLYRALGGVANRELREAPGDRWLGLRAVLWSVSVALGRTIASTCL